MKTQSKKLKKTSLQKRAIEEKGEVKIINIKFFYHVQDATKRSFVYQNKTRMHFNSFWKSFVTTGTQNGAAGN